MPFRKRSPPPDEAAADELARAREAMSYWEAQEHDATEEIATLTGVFGWINVLTGNRESLVAEARQRQENARRQIKKERMAFIAAQQAMKQHEARQAQKKRAEDERLLDLEVLATRLRDSHHPAAARLDGLESKLDRAEQQLQRLGDVVAAAGALQGAIGQIERFALQMQTRVLGLLRTPEAIAAYSRLAPLTERFADACIDAGIEPPSLQVPRELVNRAALDPMYWISGDHDWAFERFRNDLLDERDTIGMIQLQAAKERKQVTEERDALHAERRTLLEELCE